jgi:CubicO group peptidase (beta-lactamase class C family)
MNSVKIDIKTDPPIVFLQLGEEDIVLYRTGLSRRAFTAGAAGLMGVLMSGASRGRTRPATAVDGMPRKSPSATGANPEAILDFLKAIDSSGGELHSLMIYRQGAVIAEGWWSPYRPELLHMQHSLTKSVTATAVGIAIGEGRFSLTDKVASFFPEYLPANVSEHLALMTVRDLATMRIGARVTVSGKQWRPYNTSWIKKFFEIPIPDPPGTTFLYSSAPSYMLSAIVQKTTGQTVHEYLKSRFFEPLQIEGVKWDVSPEGINPGGNGFSCKTSDLLKLAAVHLQGGKWRDRQIVPKEWVSAALSPQVPASTDIRPLLTALTRENGPPQTQGNEQAQTQANAPAILAPWHGYGYQWWMGPGRAAHAGGAFGQYSIILPDHDLALAVTAAQPLSAGESFLSLVWEHAPQMIDRTQAASGAEQRLAERLQHLRLISPPAYRPSNRTSSLARKFNIQPNDQGISAVSFEFIKDKCRFKIWDARGEHTVDVGFGRFAEGVTDVTSHTLHYEYEPADGMRVAAFGEWKDEDTFVMTWQFIESAFRDTVTCHLAGDQLLIDRKVNVNNGPLSVPTIRGVAT